MCIRDSNTLPLNMFLDLMPLDIQSKARQIVADAHFPLQLEVNIGPAPLASAAEHLRGRLAFSKALIRDVPIDDLSISFERNGPDILVHNAVAQLGSEPYPSHMKIRNGRYNIPERRYEAHCSGTLNPHVLKPILSTGMRNIVEWFGVQEPVQADLMVGGEVGNPAISCYGPVQATNFTIQGVALQSFQGDLNITNEVMHINGATIIRPEGIARGEAHMAFSNQTVRLDLESTLDARDTAQMIGPAAAEFMRPFQLNGPVRLHLEGLLDYCNFSLNPVSYTHLDVYKRQRPRQRRSRRQESGVTPHHNIDFHARQRRVVQVIAHERLRHELGAAGKTGRVVVLAQIVVNGFGNMETMQLVARLLGPVSYTHLDVYKRQWPMRPALQCVPSRYPCPYGRRLRRPLPW